MSINWVMLNDTDGFVRLPDELIVFVSPRRTAFQLKSRNYNESSTAKNGKDDYCIESSNGTAYLTNQRVIYLPATPTPEFQSFSAPLLHVSDTHVSSPFFGPNVWNATVEPVPGGNLPGTTTTSSSSSIPPTLKLTFKDGGAFDFQSDFELIKERLLQIIEDTTETLNALSENPGIPSTHLTTPNANAGGGAGGGGGGTTGIARTPRGNRPVNYAAVNIEPLPAYEESNGLGGSGIALPPMHYVQHTWTPLQVPAYDDSGALTTIPVQSPPYGEVQRRQGQGQGQGQGQAPGGTPDDPPPGYEEAQRGREAVYFSRDDGEGGEGQEQGQGHRMEGRNGGR